jgi:replicative DNA helicase
MIEFETSLPYAPEAEAASLCCLIENPDRFTAFAWEAQIESGFYHNPANATLWSLISNRLKNGNAVDPVSLREAIADSRNPVLTIADLSNTLLAQFDETAWHGYVETLRDRYARRIAIEAGQSISSENQSGEDAIQSLRMATERAAAAMSGISAVLDAKSVIKAFMASVEARIQNGDMPGLSTGIDQIDQKTGGLRPGELWVVGAKTSFGKSVLMLQIGGNAVRLNKRVAVFTLEMGADEIVARTISCHWNVPMDKISNPRSAAPHYRKIIEAACVELSGSDLLVCDKADQTVESISGHCQRLSDTGKLDLVIVDYLQLVGTPKIKGQNREQEVATISRGLKQLAKRLKVPVLTATQLNEAGEARESRAIEHDADNVLFIVPQKGKESDFQTLQFWKCRNGKRGEEIQVSLDGAHQKFRFF